MPYRTTYEHFEFPKHLELPVLKELPPEFEEHTVFRPKVAWSKPPDKRKWLTFCPRCEGWVPGQAHEHRVNTLDSSRLAGRRGTEYYCPRCAGEIYFSGMMS